MPCPVCCERIPANVRTCPECGEPTDLGSLAPSTARPMSIADDPPGASWLAMHWRPLVTLGAMAALVCTGILLRYLAPGRMMPPVAKTRARAAAASATCPSACWTGETCQLGRCVWQAPNDVRHLPESPVVSGPFPLGKDVSDVLALDAGRFATALLAGVQIHDARTGQVLGLVSEAVHARRLYRVADAIYAAAPQRIYVIDVRTTKLRKTIELGTLASAVAVGASGRRALVSLPNAHAVAVIATEYHAEIDRIHFGDDAVGPVGVDDTGRRALTATGEVPPLGLQGPSGGAAYAFDPGRLASAQDRVRASMVGNPVSVLVTPGGEASWVALRAKDALVPLEWLPSGAVRTQPRVPTCREPEQVELVRRDRRAVVRCNLGRAIEVLDLMERRALRRVPLAARAVDMALSPDGEQAVVALDEEGAEAVALVDLATGATKLVPLAHGPARVRMAPDGSMAVVLSDRAKTAWVLR